MKTLIHKIVMCKPAYSKLIIRRKEHGRYKSASKPVKVKQEAGKKNGKKKRNKLCYTKYTQKGTSKVKVV